MPYQQGQVIVNRYEILSALGGGMGEVYEALDKRMGRKVALKVISEEESDPDVLAHFVDEWRALVRVEHPNVLTLYDAEEDGGRWFFTTQFLRGRTFGERIKQGRVPWREAAEWGLDLSRALEAVHAENIVHGDIKPDNVFLTDLGFVKLLDFGVATSTTSPPGTGGGFCTPAFASPEQLRYERVDARSDIFSFGILLHLLVSASHPFDYSWVNIRGSATAPPLSLTHATPEFATLVQRCLKKDREARFGTIRDVGDALRDAIAGPTIRISSSAQVIDERSFPDDKLNERRAAHPYRRTVATIVREVLDARLVSPFVRYVPGPPAALKSHVLRDIARRVQKECTVVPLTAGPRADVTAFFPSLKSQLETEGIRASSAEPDKLLSAVESRGRRVLILLDGYHHYFQERERKNEDAIGVWAAGLYTLCESRRVMIVMAGSVDPFHFYWSRGLGSLPLRISAVRLEASWEEWQQELAAAYEVDSAELTELSALSEHHAGALLEGVEALSNAVPANERIQSTLQQAGEAGKLVVPECCRTALRHFARKEAADIRCTQVLEEAGFLRREEGALVPAVSLWRKIWAEAG